MPEAVSDNSQRGRKNVRAVLTSFTAGIGAMVVFGLVAPVAVQGGLSVAEADAAPAAKAESAVSPLDLEAIRADLAQAELALRERADATDEAIARLRTIAAHDGIY